MPYPFLKEKRMKKNGLLITILGMAAVASGGLVASEFNCWDGSFGYNGASLVQTPERIELTLQGSQLGPLSLSEKGGEEVLIQGFKQTTIYVPFSTSECTFAADGKSGTCDKKALGEFPSLGVYLSRNVSDLNDYTHVISPVYIQRVTMDFSLGSVINVHFFGSRFLGRDEIDDQTVTISLDICRELSFAPPVENGFPQRLRDHLNASPDA